MRQDVFPFAGAGAVGGFDCEPPLCFADSWQSRMVPKGVTIRLKRKERGLLAEGHGFSGFQWAGTSLPDRALRRASSCRGGGG